MMASTPKVYFDRLYAADDPYGYRSRWYEARKRALLLASLPDPRCGSAWEIGCSNGELTAELAPRCDLLLATDFSERAVKLARSRVSGHPHVSVDHAHHPLEWPDQVFDLIVLGEVGYFMSRRDLEITIDRLPRSLAPDGFLVACHWRPAFAEAPLAGDTVHGALDDRLGLARIFRYEDEDFLLEGWSAAAISVAAKEGIR